MSRCFLERLHKKGARSIERPFYVVFPGALGQGPRNQTGAPMASYQPPVWRQYTRTITIPAMVIKREITRPEATVPEERMMVSRKEGAVFLSKDLFVMDRSFLVSSLNAGFRSTPNEERLKNGRLRQQPVRQCGWKDSARASFRFSLIKA
jgi:hypothetical protein